jgi:transcriptional regulator with XRE-family HTH domain
MLRDLRISRGEKLRTVAAAADMDTSLLSKIELGQRFPTRHFGVPPTELDGVRMADEILKKLAENPAAAELALARIEECAGEYRVSNRRTTGNKPAPVVNKAARVVNKAKKRN